MRTDRQTDTQTHRCTNSLSENLATANVGGGSKTVLWLWCNGHLWRKCTDYEVESVYSSCTPQRIWKHMLLEIIRFLN